MDATRACDALKSGKCLEIVYSSKTRKIEVHAVGYSKDGKLLMRAWQVSGGSSGGDSSGWKLFNLGDVANSRLTNEASAGPRNGYNKNDPALARILCQF